MLASSILGNGQCPAFQNPAHWATSKQTKRARRSRSYVTELGDLPTICGHYHAAASQRVMFLFATVAIPIRIVLDL